MTNEELDYLFDLLKKEREGYLMTIHPRGSVREIPNIKRKELGLKINVPELGEETISIERLIPIDKVNNIYLKGGILFLRFFLCTIIFKC